METFRHIGWRGEMRCDYVLEVAQKNGLLTLKRKRRVNVDQEHTRHERREYFRQQRIKLGRPGKEASRSDKRKEAKALARAAYKAFLAEIGVHVTRENKEAPILDYEMGNASKSKKVVLQAIVMFERRLGHLLDQVYDVASDRYEDSLAARKEFRDKEILAEVAARKADSQRIKDSLTDAMREEGRKRRLETKRLRAQRKGSYS